MHVVQRGNNKQPCFLDTSDYLAYLDGLRNAADRYAVDVHAYVLMTNHVHLLLTPHQESSASRTMQHLGRGYVRRFNETHKRTGTLWEGRFRSSIVDTERYLFACYRYIELNPVRAGIVAVPSDYRWSSFRANAFGSNDEIVRPRQEWLDLGASTAERCQKYRMFFQGCTANDDNEVIRAAVRSGLPAGSKRFRKNLEAIVKKRIGSGRRGRPRKEKGL